MIQLCPEKACTGCSACHNVCPRNAIAMKKDREGFLRPEIDGSLCIECHLCEKACPEINPAEKYPKVPNPIALITKDNGILTRSSSGGMFSLMANRILAKGGVVYGAAMDNGFRICHTEATSEAGLENLRGSKYAQSEIRDTFRQVRQHLRNRRYTLFTGTPCQIAGLLKFLGRADREYLITADLVCHGTPSSDMLRKYAEKLSADKGLHRNDIRNFQFRQMESWGITPSYEHSSRRVLVSDRENIYMKLFLSSRLHRPCCYQCRYTTPERVADITIGDFWGIGKKQPFAYDHRQGCSLVLLNSEKGKALFDEIAGSADYDIRRWDEALQENHQLHLRSRLPKDRNKAISALLSDDSLQHIHSRFFNTPMCKCRRFAGRILRRLKLR